MVVAACLLLEYGVVRRGGRGRLVAVPQRAARQPVRLHDPRELVAGAGGRRDLQPARGGPGRALHAAADPRRERVGEGQRGDGADQARRAGPVRRARPAGLETRDNLSDFTPFGLGGITSAAGIIFFSYIGLDAVSTAGEEVKNPRRTMPLAIIIALVTVTAVYIAVAIVAVAAQPIGGVRGPGGRAGRDPRGRHRVDLARDRARRGRGDLDLQRDAGRASTARRGSCSRWAATG